MSETTPSILVVDDEPLVLKSLEHLVAKAGYQITTSGNPEEALRLANFQEFSVILSDYQMPEMTGSEFLKQITHLQPNASRILMTGVRSLDVVVNAVNAGEIFRFVPKPWVNAEMLVTLRNAVQRYELVKETQKLRSQTETLCTELASANTRLAAQVEDLDIQKRSLDESRAALRANFDHSLKLCHRIVSMFNPILGEQAKAAVALCQSLAESPHLNDEEKHVLVVSAWLYDIGLTGIPHGLTKAVQNDGRDLSPETQSLIKNHTILGQTLASFVDNLKSVGDTIRSHHERFDGQGYPDGLARAMIPWTARILAVVVYYVSCGLSHEEAVDCILAKSGTAFDPEAVRLFLRSSQATTLPHFVKEVMLDELRSGMQLASGIYSPSGILLVAKGHHLDEAAIHKIRNHSDLTSLPQQLLVFS